MVVSSNKHILELLTLTLAPENQPLLFKIDKIQQMFIMIFKLTGLDAQKYLMTCFFYN